jgi:histidinol phosphatase-like enzyme
MTIYDRKTSIFINMDNTVRRSRYNKDYIIGPSDIEIIPGRKPILSRLQRNGFNVIGISHQVGIGLRSNFYVDDLVSGMKKTNELLDDGKFDKLVWSTIAHEDYTDVRVLTHPINDMHLRHYNCLFVGNSEFDSQLARQLRIDYIDSTIFFNHLVPVLG